MLVQGSDPQAVPIHNHMVVRKAIKHHKVLVGPKYSNPIQQ
jgi:hypothetical protein